MNQVRLPARLFLTVLLAALPAVAEAQKVGNVLTTLEAMETGSYRGSTEEMNHLPSRLAWTLAEAGDYAGAHGAFDPYHGGPQTSGTPQGAAPVDAFAAIAQAAETAQVIMINEAHHVPQHRAFTLQLLEMLRQKGFTYFAAEMLNHFQDFSARGFYPNMYTGSYIGEPLAGDLVRTAVRLGYKVVAYEAIDGMSVAKREPEQATRLIENTLRKDPKAKILVHCGFDHNNEALLPPWMAGHFQRMSGIDPVTINQYWMTERSTPEYEEPAYQWATEHGLVTRPVVFRDAAGAFWKPKAGFDLVVFHPRSQYENGRPAWLRLGGLRSPYLLPMWICGTAKRCLVQARLAAEGKDAIPVDQVLVSAGKPAPALMLPKGDFVVRVEGADGALIDQMPVRMP